MLKKLKFVIILFESSFQENGTFKIDESNQGPTFTRKNTFYISFHPILQYKEKFAIPIGHLICFNYLNIRVLLKFITKFVDRIFLPPRKI